MASTIELLGGPEDGSLLDWPDNHLPAFLNVSESSTRYEPWTDRPTDQAGVQTRERNGRVLYRYAGPAREDA
jgi:hypothetical protein